MVLFPPGSSRQKGGSDACWSAVPSWGKECTLGVCMCHDFVGLIAGGTFWCVARKNVTRKSIYYSPLPFPQQTQPGSPASMHQASQHTMPSPPSTSRRLAIKGRRRLRPLPTSIIVVLAFFSAPLCISTTAFVLPSPSKFLASPRATPPHHQQHDLGPNPSILTAWRRLLQDTSSLLLLSVAPSLAFTSFPALSAAVPAPQTTTTKAASRAAAAANLPADVIATAIVSLGKNANIDRLLVPSPSTSTTISSVGDKSAPQEQVASPALYVTARVGSRGRVLASIKLPLQSLPSPAFPASVEIKEGDIYADTPEAQHAIALEIQTSDLVLSARLDQDGRASTRSPQDLVGQATLYKFKSVDSAQWSRADIALTGRGAFGEFVTGSGKGK